MGWGVNNYYRGLVKSEALRGCSKLAGPASKGCRIKCASALRLREMSTRRTQNRNGVLMPAAFSPSVRRAFAQLLEVHELARASGRKDSDFAAEITSLTELGISGSVLRWLVCRGYARCLREVTQPGDKERRFEPVDNLALSSQSCFVLSRKGMLFARAALALGDAGAEVMQGNGNSGSAEPQGNGLAPSWDARRRELRLSRKLLKRFRVPRPIRRRFWPLFRRRVGRIASTIRCRPRETSARSVACTTRSKR